VAGREPAANPRHAVSFEPVLPVVLAGATTAGASVPIGGKKAAAGLPVGFGKPSPGEPALQARAAHAFSDLVSVDTMIHDLRPRPTRVRPPPINRRPPVPVAPVPWPVSST